MLRLSSLVVFAALWPFSPACAQAGPGDVLLAGANARIERVRKADVKVLVTDARGRPFPKAVVTVEQTNHAFLFGCAALTLTQHSDAAKEALYQKRFGDLFNFATVLTYWQDTEPEQGKLDVAVLSARVRRLKEMGLRIKGHPLILAGASPRWAPVDPDATRELTQKRILQLVAQFKGQIELWDVVGDATTAKGAQNGLGAWARKAGPAQLTADALTWARTANPGALLLYNDYKLDQEYFQLIQDIQRIGAPLDVLGLEAHMIGSEWPLEKVWDTAERFATLKRPLHFSEITVLSDDPLADHSKAWPSTPQGEQRQAEYVEKLYTLLFSNPAVVGIGWWNFVDGDWDRNPGGLLRADLTPKPAYDRLVALIRHKWHTSATLATDRAGSAAFRGFAGRYRITVQAGKLARTVEADVARGRENEVLVRLAK